MFSGAPQQLGQLLVPVALQVEADDRLAGGRRQRLEGGQDRLVDLTAGPGVLRGGTGLAAGQPLGHLGRQTLEREPVSAAQRHPGLVGRDRVQPGAEPGRVGQPRQPQKGRHGGLLGDVLGQRARAQQPLAQPQHARLPARQQRAECLAVAGQHGRDQVGVVAPLRRVHHVGSVAPGRSKITLARPATTTSDFDVLQARRGRREPARHL